MTSSLLGYIQQGAGALSQRHHSPVKPLAAPPVGSGLDPVFGDFGLPLLGHTLDTMSGDPMEFALDRFDRYGEVYWLGSLGTKMVGAVGPDALESITLNKDKAWGNEGFYNYLIGPFFKRGVMLMDFGEHVHHRRIMQEAFTRPRLVGYLEAMQPRIKAEVANWQPGEAFHVYSAAKQLTLDVAAEVFVGDRDTSNHAAISKAFVDAVHGGQAIIRADVPGGIWRRGLRGRRLLEDYFYAQIPAKRANPTNDLFSVLCHSASDEGDTYTDEDIVNHMIFVMMAAHDTSTITLAMMAYYLGRNPEWQERLRQESLALGKDFIEYDDIEKLPVMDMVMRETLRIHAPVGGLFREAVKDTELCGRYIPEGTRLFASIFASQRMEPWWSNPLKFDPERFSPERREDKKHRFMWTPFGGGAHKCIGLYFGEMEIKAVMHQMVRQFDWSVPRGYYPPLRYGTGPMPTDGLPLQLRSLRQANAA
ncbi:cytochrome P450 [Aldersonia kunmingensis]|uniref:cytochrome P450 n=1 Tax=Aldersonia kunmingensis TaxID=408066 RepID=UPI0009FC4EF5|nr:cytochrome P450 [Aldersonia kunmingensis]